MFHLHQYILLIIDLIGSEVYHYSCGNNNQTHSPESNTLMVLPRYPLTTTCLFFLYPTGKLTVLDLMNFLTLIMAIFLSCNKPINNVNRRKIKKNYNFSNYLEILIFLINIEFVAQKEE